MPEPTRPDPDHLLALTPPTAVGRLAAPTTGVMAVSAVSNVVYTYFVSRLGTDAIGAVSLVFPVSLLALAAQALALSVAIGLAFGLVVQMAAPTFFRALGATGVVHHQATLFARVLFGGAAITFLGGMFDSVMRGEGNVRVPAVWSTTSLVLQMVTTPVFMFGLGWGLVGAAAAMLASQL